MREDVARSRQRVGRPCVTCVTSHTLVSAALGEPALSAPSSGLRPTTRSRVEQLVSACAVVDALPDTGVLQCMRGSWFLRRRVLRIC